MASSEPGPLGELEHVGIVVADLERARSFFAEVLGLSVGAELTLPEPALKILFVSSGSVRIELFEILDEEVRRERLGDAEGRIDHLAFRVDELDPAADAAAAAGVELRGGLAPDSPRAPIRGAGTLSLFSREESSLGVSIQLIQMPDQEEER